MMEVMMSEKKKFSELLDGFVPYPQLLVNVRVADKATVRADEDIIAAINKAEARLGSEGRILVRESGTEPVIRVMAEAKSKELCDECVYSIVDAIKNKGYEVKA